MKVDLKKAYDSIEWDFIRQMLHALAFPDKMIQWIMECVTTPWYTLSLNGSNFGYFQDDLLMFCRGDKASIIIILRAFATFSKASRLEINCEKSDIYFNGMSSEDSQYILGVSGFKEGQFSFRYLGIPISYKIMAVGDCSRLIEKIVQRIRGWGARKLSYDGRLVLVQAVLTQLHSFWTRIFIIHVTVMDRINHICRNYLWSGSEEFHKTSHVAWEKVCVAKKYGGLGIVNGKNWNLAMLGKYVWWLAEKSDHLWIRWVNHMYIKDQTWMDYSPSVCSSWTWRKICQVKDLFKPAYCHGKWSTYNVYVGYAWLQGNIPKVPWYPIIWNILNLPKHSIIGWLAIQCRLLTKDRLLRFGIITNAYCDMCLDHPKDHSHMLYGCRFSACWWKLSAAWLDVPLPSTEIWTARRICRVESKLIHPTYAVKNVIEMVKSRGMQWKWTSKYQYMHWAPWLE
ncbi:uncharacterized protein LOC141628554 [Silene latifolia]|uniref:uncharacterized protein LOC141628554 n=1 Tax=Silene latifolia TaxID=37657 RepID=UPI003D77786E